ncbi:MULTISPECIES: hypothetical protein [unclassified Caballeronia]|uniref:hypothetical protein n=1 Tax=unclassified Caballeronia TaxID=2646786 RepID=UPI0020289392|nr:MULTISPECIES: hypothetical protein [unclassified Caballeronia]
MQIKPEQPFDVPRENLRLGLRWVQLANDWRKHLCAIQMQKIELDARTVSREREAIAACNDWNEVASSTQTIMRDYVAQMMSLAQESIGLELSEKDAVTQVLSKSLMDWQQAWLRQASRFVRAGNIAEFMPLGVMRGDESEARAKGDQHVA